MTDPSGSVVSGATVTLTNTQTNTVRNTKTSPEGTYVFDLIIPATYKVTVEATGFQSKDDPQSVRAVNDPTAAFINHSRMAPEPTKNTRKPAVLDLGQGNLTPTAS